MEWRGGSGESSFSGGGGTPAEPRGVAYQSVAGEGTMMSHHFQGGVGDRDESSFPRRGLGTVKSHP